MFLWIKFIQDSPTIDSRVHTAGTSAITG